MIDDVCVLNAMHCESNGHDKATLAAHTGSAQFARPSAGSWVSYGPGTENQNLPSFMVLAPAAPYAGAQTWGSDFLPGCHQGTQVIPGKNPLPNTRPRATRPALQKMELDLLAVLNRAHQKTREADQALDARIRSFETAFGMQREAPEAFDLSGETKATLDLYGLERGATTGFGWQCLVARRLAERGVRFLELIDVGSNSNWDSHGNMADHAKLVRAIDQPIAGLLTNLQQLASAAVNRDDRVVILTMAHYLLENYTRKAFRDGQLDYGIGDVKYAAELWGKPDQVGAGITEHNRRTRAVSQQHENVQLVDLEQQVEPSGRNFSDICHLTRIGQQRVVDVVAPVVVRVVEEGRR